MEAVRGNIKGVDYTKILTYYMVTIGLGATSLIDGIEPLFLTIIGGLIMLSLMGGARKALTIPSTLWNSLALFIFVLFLGSSLVGSGDLLINSSRFIALLSVSKLYDLRSTRDYVVIYILVFFQLLASAGSTVSPLFFPLIGLFILGIIWAMIIFNLLRDSRVVTPPIIGEGEGESDGAAEEKIKRASRKRVPQRMELPRGIFTTAFFTGTVLITLLSILITLLLFFIIPRMGAGFFQRQSLDTVKVAGFSDTMDLGVIGEVKANREAVMRIEFPAFKGGDRLRDDALMGLYLKKRYIRGKTLDTYEDKRWTRTITEKERIIRSGENLYKVPIYTGLGGVRGISPYSGGGGNINGRQGGGYRFIEQRILLEPLNTEVLFGLTRVVALQGPSIMPHTDTSGAITLPSSPYKRIEYSAWSLGEESVDEGPLTPEEVSLYTGVPEFGPELSTGLEPGIDPEVGKDLNMRTQSLLATISAGGKAGGDLGGKIERYLKDNYSYTIDPRGTEGGEPIDDFLFKYKEGYCEHFATSMVILLRSAGIPARIVTGFLPGEWNDYGKYLLIRQQDAHSWVEAYILKDDGTYGWQTFDPTPNQGIVTPVKTSQIGMYMDYIRSKWMRHIIQYTSTDQVRFAMGIEGKLERLLRELRSKAGGESTGGWILMGLALLAVLLGAVWMISRGRDKVDRGAKVPAFYTDLLKLLKGRGFTRGVGETPMELALRSGLEGAVPVTEVFERLRYSRTKPGEKELEGAEGIVNRMKGSRP